MTAPDLMNRTVLFIGPSNAPGNEALLYAVQCTQDALERLGYNTIGVADTFEGLAIIKSRASLSCVVMSMDAPHKSEAKQENLLSIIAEIRKRDIMAPLFLATDQASVRALPLDILREIREYVQFDADSPSCIAGRIAFAVRQYKAALLPPYFAALKAYAEEHAYDWGALGHQGGAFFKHPVGREFLNFFGPNIVRADLGVPVTEFGGWIKHNGATGESERLASRVFGANTTFYVAGGVSQANKVVGHAVLCMNQLVLVDRSCYRSVVHELAVTRTRPVYFKPTRNGFGIVGLIPPEQFALGSVRRSVGNSSFLRDAAGQAPVLAVISTSTCDGIVCDVDRVTAELGRSVPRVQFDEASFFYAKFHPLYQGRYAMGVPEDMVERPTLFSVQSPYKILPAFSPASMLHIKESSRSPVRDDVFQQTISMYDPTAPFCPLIASLDVTASMMAGKPGQALVYDAVVDAINFRKTLVSVKKKIQAVSEKDWAFDIWQPEHVRINNEWQLFEEVDTVMLAERPECWLLGKDQAWHGFGAVEDGYAMLDPLKVTITCPGIDAQGKMSDFGIPAPIVAKFLHTRRIVPTKVGEYCLLADHAFASTQRTWGAFIHSLIEFKNLHDTGARVEDVLPGLAKRYERYSDFSLNELCAAIHASNRLLRIPELAQLAIQAEPQTVLTPAEAHECMVSGQTESVRVADSIGRVVGLAVAPSSSGMPFVLAGERIHENTQSIVEYLIALQAFARKFPGFEPAVEGVQVDSQGEYWLCCIIE